MVLKKQPLSPEVESSEHLKWFKDHYCYAIDPLVMSYLSKQDRGTGEAAPMRPTDASMGNFFPVPEIFFSSDIEAFNEPARGPVLLEPRRDPLLLSSASPPELRPQEQSLRVELDEEPQDSTVVANGLAKHETHEPVLCDSPSRAAELDTHPLLDLSSQISEDMSCATTVSAPAVDNLEQLRAQKASISEQICDLIELNGDEQLLQELRERRRALDQKIVRLTSNEQAAQPTSNR